MYKTVKEEIDRIERKFTQAEIDAEILRHLSRNAGLSQISDAQKFNQLVKNWEQYAHQKEKDGEALKYDGEKLKPEYHFLEFKLEAIEKIIRKTFGEKILDEIKASYEDEMHRRILESREKT